MYFVFIVHAIGSDTRLVGKYSRNLKRKFMYENHWESKSDTLPMCVKYLMYAGDYSFAVIGIFCINLVRWKKNYAQRKT